MSNTDPFGLRSDILEKINAVFSKISAVESVKIYGSRAKGNYRNGSDIDLSCFGDSLTHSDLLRLIDDLDALWLPWKIDLSLFKNISNEKLKEHIQRMGIEIYKRQV